MLVMAAAEQTVCDDGVATASGVGFTSTVAVTGVPGLPFAVGVMIKLTLIGMLVVLVNVPEISPEPETAMPVTETVLSLTQANVVPVTLLLKTISMIASREQTV